MHGISVGVLRGGPSLEHEVSLQSGHTILANLPRDRYTGRDIYIDKQGTWFERGRPVEPGRVLPTTDVAVVAVHGTYGEDGAVQKLLERYGVPYVGANSFHSFQAAHKVFAKEHARSMGIRTPKYRFAERAEDAEAIAHDVVRSFSQPVLVKPARGGSSIGVSIVGGFKPVYDAIMDILETGEEGALIEEYIRGTEATVGIVEGLRGERLYALPPIEILPPEGHEFFSFEAKYAGHAKEISPGRFTKPVAEELMQAARTMHEALGQRHYSRSDFVVSKNGIYFLELNSAAAVGMTSESLLPKSLVTVGVTLPDFLTHVIDIARTRS